MHWSEAPGDAPGFHIVHHKSGEWEFIAGPQAKEHFTLAGGGTKKPPISRPALLLERQADRLHLVYRSDHHGGRVLGATLADLSEAEWAHGYLTEGSVGAWEPSIDPAQWRQAGQAHMLLQDVAQVDGDDSVGKRQEATPIRLLLWHPEGKR